MPRLCGSHARSDWKESDTRVFERAAAPGEWAVCGAFAFADPEALAGKQRQGFVSSFLGTTNFERTTFVEVAEIADDDHAAVIQRLALHFITDHGAPDLAAALPVACDEAAFAASLCEHKLHTLLAVERALADDGIVERIRVIRPGHAQTWTIDDAG